MLCLNSIHENVSKLSSYSWLALGFDSVSFFSICDLKSGYSRVPVTLIFTSFLLEFGGFGGLAILPVWVGKSFQNQRHIGNFAFHLAKFFLASSAYSVSHRLVKWHSNGDCNVVLNVEGSCIGNLGPSGMGGLLRSSDGVWLDRFAGFFGITNNLPAELLALLHGFGAALRQRVPQHDLLF